MFTCVLAIVIFILNNTEVAIIHNAFHMYHYTKKKNELHKVSHG